MAILSDEKKTNINLTEAIFSLFKGESKDIAAIIVYAIGVGICTLAVPIAVQSLVNSVAFGALLQPIVVLTIIVGGVLTINGILKILQYIVAEFFQRRLIIRFSLYLSKKLPHLIVQKFHREYGPEYILRFMEVFNTQKIMSYLLLDGIALFFQLIIGIIVVSFYHPFFLVFSVLLLIIYLCIVIGLGIGGIKSSIKESSAKYDVVSWFQDLASVPTLFKSEAGDLYSTLKTDRLLSDYLDYRAKHFKVLLRQNISALFLQTLASAALLMLGGYLVLIEELTLGQLVAAEIILSAVLLNIIKSGKQLELFYDLVASLDKLKAISFLPTEDIIGSVKRDLTKPAEITLHKVTISSTRTNYVYFDEISLTIPPGTLNLITGQDGSGKSSLADSIYRLQQIQSGWIEFDGVNINNIDPHELRTDINIIQDVEFFHGTMLDNLTLGKYGEMDQIREVLKDLDLLSVIESQQGGFDSYVRGSWGPFSSGQALRVMIARGLISKPRLLIIDGTLDGIDQKYIPRILDILKKYAETISIIIFSHNSYDQKYFDQVFDIDEDLKKLKKIK